MPTAAGLGTLLAVAPEAVAADISERLFIDEAAMADEVVLGKLDSLDAEALVVDGVKYAQRGSDPGEAPRVGGLVVAYARDKQIHRATLVAVDEADLPAALAFYDAVLALIQGGPAADVAVVEITNSVDADVLPVALWHLVGPAINHKPSTATIDWAGKVALEQARHPILRCWAVSHVARFGSPDDLPLIEALLYDTNSDVVIEALAGVRALGGSASDVEWLLTSTDASLRRAAAHTYGSIGDLAEPLTATYDASGDIFDRVAWVEAVRLLPEPERTIGLTYLAAQDSEPMLSNLLDSGAP